MRLLRLVLFALLTRAQYPSNNLLESKGGSTISRNGMNTEGRIFMDTSYHTALCQCRMESLKMESNRELKFGIKDVYRNTRLLPGIALRFRIYNGPGMPIQLRAMLAALTGQQKDQLQSCTFPRVPALFGPSLTRPSRGISKTINCFNISLMCYLAAFIRTVPSDHFQTIALVQLTKQLVFRMGTYPEDGSATFSRIEKNQGICAEHIQQSSRSYSSNKTCEVSQTIKSPTSKVCLTFMSKSYFEDFLERLEEMNVTNKQWIGKEAWISNANLLTKERARLLHGAVGFAIRESQIPDLTEFFLSLQPSDTPDGVTLRTFWETMFDCSFSVCLKICTTFECTYVPLPTCQALKNVFRAVLAMAHVVHTLVFIQRGQSDHTLHTCQNQNGFQPQVPVTVSKGHTIGNRNTGICIACPHEEIHNQRDTSGYSSDILENRFTEDGNHSTFAQGILGFLPAMFFILGVFFTATVAIIMFWYRHNAITRANNSELSFLLLFSLKLCFLCSLTFIGRPSEWSCMLRHTAFGITFVLCISCVLGKTIVVLMAFRATLPGSSIMKWFGPLHQRLSVLAFTLIQVLICALWLTISPPVPNKNMKHYKERVILECDIGSAVGFWGVLGYLGLLSGLCFVLVFVVRKLPIGESVFIFFSMITCHAAWIVLIQMYVTAPTKYTLIIKIVSTSTISRH